MRIALRQTLIGIAATAMMASCQSDKKTESSSQATKSSEPSEEPKEPVEEEEDEAPDEEQGARSAEEEGEIGQPDSPVEVAAAEDPPPAPAALSLSTKDTGKGLGYGGMWMTGKGRGGGGGGSFSVGGLGTAGRGSGNYGRGKGNSLGRLSNSGSTSTTPTQPGNIVKQGSSTDWGVNAWSETEKDKLSTFAVDVDTGAYTISRRSITEGARPDPATVRVEEFVNYFDYPSYARPTGQLPFEVSLEGGPAPFNNELHIMRVGVQGKALTDNSRKPANLTFLVDVSGSMRAADKLPLAKKSLRMIVDQMQPGDTISLVTYAGNTRVVLEPTEFKDRTQIEDAIEDLKSGGSTAMESGLVLAYKQATAAKRDKTVNRVIVLSDGDANVGKTGHQEILKSIASYVEQGITLTTVGFGRGNVQDTKMEQLANKGNGNYFYIDTPSQAKRVFQTQLSGNLQVIAKDVKIQVEFDPNVVEKYRLIGYENRDIADKDFRNDKVDAGEIGAGHSVTALYELKLKKDGQGDVATVRLRHKKPDASQDDPADENSWPLGQDKLSASFEALGEDTRFAFAVVAFAEVLRKSPGATDWKLDAIAEIAQSAAGNSAERAELVGLVEKSDALPAHSAKFAGGGTFTSKGGPSPGKVKHANPEVVGSLDRRIIRKVINQHKRESKKCYTDELAKDTNLAGKIEVKFVIDEKGQVASASVNNDVMKGNGSKTVGSCLTGAIKNWRFPAPKGGGLVQVKYPFVFSAR